MKCSECGMGYSEQNSKNIRLHKQYNDQVANGIKYKKYKSENIIFSEDDLLISVIDESSNKYERENAVKVGILGYLDAGYDTRPFDAHEVFDERTQVKVFLLHKQNRTIGFLAVEQAKLKWPMTWQEYEMTSHPYKVQNGKTLWSGRFIWIHKKHRLNGYAKKLVESALRYLKIKIDDFGYSTQLFENGVKLAKSISPKFLGTRVAND